MNSSSSIVIDGIPTVRHGGTKLDASGGGKAASTKTLSTSPSCDSFSLGSSTEDDAAAFILDLEVGDLLAPKDSMETATSNKPSLIDFFLEPKISKGNQTIPLQSESRHWLKYLIWIPICTLASITFVAYFWIPLFQEKGVLTTVQTFVWETLFPNRLAMILLVVLPTVGWLVEDLLTEVWIFVMLWRGKQRRHLPADRLVHAVIVCNYKEPLEVLRATISSIADNTLAANTMVILACEARDTEALSTFQSLSTEFEGRLRSLTMTSHVLAPGEVVGKSSNENYACRELYKMIQKEGLDPFQVMVTTCDADSLFDQVFFEQVEAEYARTPDGRRFLYNSPINTYRNLTSESSCWNPLIKAFEIRRCQYDLFCGPCDFRPTQSNYSLTLGFAHELNYWDPTNTSEDFHTTLKAMAMTGKASTAEVVVKVWSLILNDSVTDFRDRWIQAKRHMWGIEESAFVMSLFPILRLNQWLGLFSRVVGQMFGVCIPTGVWLLFPSVRQVWFALQKETQYLLIGMAVAGCLYGWIKTFLREVFLYKYIIGDRRLLQHRTTFEWISMFLVWPILSELSYWIFATAATWRMLFHAIYHDTLVYVTAPKALITTTTTAGTAIVVGSNNHSSNSENGSILRTTSQPKKSA